MTSTEINGKKPKFFNSAIAANGDKNTIDATGTDEQVSQSLGFGNKFSTPRGSGGKSVGRRDMNGLFHDVSSLNYYFQYMGRNPWKEPTGDDDAYPQGAKVWYNNAEYVSTVDKNRAVPGADGVTTWIKLNDLSGTSGGGSTVSCSWSSIPPSSISGIVTNTEMIPSISSNIQSLTGNVSAISAKVDSIDLKVSGSAGGDILYNADLYDYTELSCTVTSYRSVSGLTVGNFTFEVPTEYSSKGFRIVAMDASSLPLLTYTNGHVSCPQTGLSIGYDIQEGANTHTLTTWLVIYNTLGYEYINNASTSDVINTAYGLFSSSLPSGMIKGTYPTVKATMLLNTVPTSATLRILIAKIKD